jgi:hypothetical protein
MKILLEKVEMPEVNTTDRKGTGKESNMKDTITSTSA